MNGALAKQTERETERERERESERKKEREGEKGIQRERNREGRRERKRQRERERERKSDRESKRNKSEGGTATCVSSPATSVDPTQLGRGFGASALENCHRMLPQHPSWTEHTGRERSSDLSPP